MFRTFCNSSTPRRAAKFITSSATVGAAAAATMPDATTFLQSLTLIGPTIYRGATTSLLMGAWAGSFGTLVDQPAYAAGEEGPFNFSREFRMQSLPLRAGLTLEFITSISGADCCLNEKTVLVDNGWDGASYISSKVNSQPRFKDAGDIYNLRCKTSMYAELHHDQAPCRGETLHVFIFVLQFVVQTSSSHHHCKVLRSVTVHRCTPIKSFLEHHPFIVGVADILPPSSTLPTSLP